MHGSGEHPDVGDLLRPAAPFDLEDPPGQGSSSIRPSGNPASSGRGPVTLASRVPAFVTCPMGTDPVEDGQHPAHLGDEIQVARRVDQVDGDVPDREGPHGGLIVIPRRRSSGSESVWVMPASTAPSRSMAPESYSSRSVRVVLPAST